MYRPLRDDTCGDQLRCIVKHTFLDVCRVDECGSAVLRRQKSDPLFKSPSNRSYPEVKFRNIDALDSPSTCASSYEEELTEGDGCKSTATKCSFSRAISAASSSLDDVCCFEDDGEGLPGKVACAGSLKFDHCAQQWPRKSYDFHSWQVASFQHQWPDETVAAQPTVVSTFPMMWPANANSWFYPGVARGGESETGGRVSASCPRRDCDSEGASRRSLTSAQPRDDQPAAAAVPTERENEPKVCCTICCPFCGSEAMPHFKFCRYCGKQIASVLEAQQQPGSS